MYIFVCGFAHMELLSLVNLQSCLELCICYDVKR